MVSPFLRSLPNELSAGAGRSSLDEIYRGVLAVQRFLDTHPAHSCDEIRQFLDNFEGRTSVVEERGRVGAHAVEGRKQITPAKLDVMANEFLDDTWHKSLNVVELLHLRVLERHIFREGRREADQLPFEKVRRIHQTVLDDQSVLSTEPSNKRPVPAHRELLL